MRLIRLKLKSTFFKRSVAHSRLRWCEYLLPIIILTLMLSLGSSVQIRAEVGRPMNLDDLSNLQQIAWGYGGPFAFSPDGQQLAFAVQRPKRTAKFHTGNLSGVDRADIFVVS